MRRLTARVHAVADALDRVKEKAIATRGEVEQTVRLTDRLARLDDAASGFGNQFATEAFSRETGEKAGGFITAAYARQIVDDYARIIEAIRTGRHEDGTKLTPFEMTDAMRGRDFRERFFKDTFPQFGDIKDLARDLLEYFRQIREAERRGNAPDDDDDGGGLTISGGSASGSAVARGLRRISVALPAEEAEKITKTAEQTGVVIAMTKGVDATTKGIAKAVDESALQAKAVAQQLYEQGRGNHELLRMVKRMFQWFERHVEHGATSRPAPQQTPSPAQPPAPGKKI